MVRTVVLRSFRENLLKRLWQAPTTRKLIIDGFHRLWYEAPDSWTRNRYLGRPISQLPFDLWLYQELIHDERPAFVLQTGVWAGGSLLFFAHLLDLIDAPDGAIVIGVDLDPRPEAKTLSHPRIRLLEGDSVAASTIARIEGWIPAAHGLVSLDSDHSCQHVRRELELYHRFVAPGAHMVVEDTNLNGHPVASDFGPGPCEAVDQFLAAHPEFERDEPFWERNLISFHQHGWLRRLA